MTSPDGVVWTARASAADNAWLGVEWSDDIGLFAALANTGTGNRVMTSPDGIVWTARPAASDFDWRAIAWSPQLGAFCGVGGSGTGTRAMMSAPAYGAEAVRGRGVEARPLRQRISELATLLDYGAAGDGMTNDTAAVSRATADGGDRWINLCGRTYLVDALPDYTGNRWSLPAYYHGYFRVGGVDYPMGDTTHAIISGEQSTGAQRSTKGSAILIGADRSKVEVVNEGARVVAAGVSRIWARGTNNFMGGISVSDLSGDFNSTATACRFVEANGQTSLIASSLLSRTFGFQGVNDRDPDADGLRRKDRWGLVLAGEDGPFSPSGSTEEIAISSFNGDTDEDPKDCFYNTILGSMAGDIRSGSNNVIIGSRADSVVGTTNFQIIKQIIVDGSGAGVYSCRNSGKINADSTAVIASSDFFIRPNASGADKTLASAMIASGGSSIYNCHWGVVLASYNGRLTSAGSDRDMHFLLGTLSSSAGGGAKTNGGSVLVDNVRGAGVISSQTSHSNGTFMTLVGSRNTESVSTYSIGGGYSPTAITSDGASSKNMKWRIGSIDGIGRFSGGTSTMGADYAEMRELATPGQALEPGDIVVREPGTRKVRKGRAGDDARFILGVVSVNPSVLGNADDLEWRGRYVRDEWGRPATRKVTVVSWPEQVESAPEVVTREAFSGAKEEAARRGLDIPAHAVFSGEGEAARVEWPRESSPGYERRVRDGFSGSVESMAELGLTAPEDATFEELDDFVDRGDFDITRRHTPRRDRPKEWCVTGMTGQLPVRIGPDAEPDFWLDAAGGRSEAPTRIMLEEIVRPYDAATGYGVGWATVG
ncbi:peptidase G2 autoproteolytic cleavage domain-containing protein [Methylopila henanensis]|uniref:Peptidase G2 autoproteolytic cleavage domain-containing protein n=1 Tax=Methylopila henanensis TaxID=873516 RepID=A0ABW4K6N6_9HYPH